MFDEDEVSDTLGDIGNNVPMLATHTINDLEQKAAILCVDEPEIELHNWLNLTSVLVARARQIRQQIEQIAIKWIEANGPVVSGDLEYTVGYRREVRCLDRQRTLDMILECSGGDLSTIVDHLRADPYKYGSVRGLIGESKYNQVFKAKSRPKLHCGVPQIELLATNTRFVRTRASASQSPQKALAPAASESKANP
jgi:hypothetical protein